VPAGTEVASAREVAEEIARGAPLALSATRATLRRGLSEGVRDAMAHELFEQSLLAGTEDAVEGVAAMLAGRHPRFSGR
jgi:enoyl-CoA hydratase/carnithine racemase